MKKRYGFVSNSSSSSYTCDVCGNNESGWDLCISEIDMSECVNGHTFCNDHAKGISLADKKDYLVKGMQDDPEYFDYEMSIVAKIEQNDEDTINDLYDTAIADCDAYEVSERCPVCTFAEPCSDDIYKYLIKKYNLTERQILDEIKGMFGSYKDFLNSIK